MQWMNYAENNLLSALSTFAFDKMGIRKDKEAGNAKKAFLQILAVLDDYLKFNTYFVGNRITLADITLACALLLVHQQKLDIDCEKKYINVHRWFTTCVNQPNFKAVLGTVCGGKQAEELGEDGEPKKKPETDPFAALPAGTFKMDEWKRTFSNNDFTSVALPYFWQNFDKENYSLWACEYKPQYAKELTHVFMTCNLVNGMYQRLEKMRKHSFGCMTVFGVKNDNTIAGCFAWRGQGLAFELSEDLQTDYESYNWRKVDPDSEEAKKLVADYWGRNEGMNFNGKAFSQAFIWK